MGDSRWRASFLIALGIVGLGCVSISLIILSVTLPSAMGSLSSSPGGSDSLGSSPGASSDADSVPQESLTTSQIDPLFVEYACVMVAPIGEGVRIDPRLREMAMETYTGPSRLRAGSVCRAYERGDYGRVLEYQDFFSRD